MRVRVLSEVSGMSGMPYMVSKYEHALWPIIQHRVLLGSTGSVVFQKRRPPIRASGSSWRFVLALPPLLRVITSLPASFHAIFNHTAALGTCDDESTSFLSRHIQSHCRPASLGTCDDGSTSFFSRHIQSHRPGILKNVTPFHSGLKTKLGAVLQDSSQSSITRSGFVQSLCHKGRKWAIAEV